MRRITFGVGQGVSADGSPLRNVESLRLEAYAHVARTFGGFHADIGSGGWIDPRGKLVLEASLVLTVYSDAPDAAVYASAEYLRALFTQESVLVAFAPARLEFVGAPSRAA